MSRRVLLDECVPRRLKDDLGIFSVRTVREMGWSGTKNGALIQLAAAEFDAVFTVDRDFAGGVRGTLPLAVVILQVGSTDFAVLRPHMPAVVQALEKAQNGEIVRVGV